MPTLFKSNNEKISSKEGQCDIRVSESNTKPKSFDSLKDQFSLHDVVLSLSVSCRGSFT